MRNNFLFLIRFIQKNAYVACKAEQQRLTGHFATLTAVMKKLMAASFESKRGAREKFFSLFNCFFLKIVSRGIDCAQFEELCDRVDFRISVAAARVGNVVETGLIFVFVSFV